ncbi:MAG: transglycosylase domain-containing protein [Spirochaetales bacterium]|nr:transglycosylase domain-containing protein [Spirochaetales bacterium]
MHFFKNLSFHSFSLRQAGKGELPQPPKKLDKIFLSEYDSTRLAGFLFKKLAIFVVGTVFIFHVALIVYALVLSLAYSFFNPPATSLMAERYVTRHYIPKPVLFIPLKKIPKYIPAMYVRVEDKNFYTHAGIDFEAIKRAYQVNSKYDKIILGGSTITQQLTRTLFLVPSRNYLRKYMEVIIALILDGVMSKERILELYLNYIEWGKGVYGLGAAVQYHYKKPISHLTREEFCRLAAIIVNPLDYNVNNFYKQPSMRSRYNALLNL